MTNTDYLENAILNHVFRGVTYPSPSATLFLGLFTSAPGETGGGTEVAGNGYARQSISFAAPGAPGTGTAGQILNSNNIVFPVATPSGWGTITHGAIFDASTAGNMLRFAAVGTPKLVGAGDAPNFPIGSVLLTQD